MNFTKSFLIATVAVGAMTLSACGKKKEEAKDLGAPAPAAPAPTPPTAGQAPQPPVQQQGPTQQGPIKPAPGASTQPGADRGQNGRTARPSKPPEKPPVPRRNGSGEVQDAPDIETAKHHTGAQNNDGLLYTGSASDETLEDLRKLESQNSTEQQQRNKDLAQSIEAVEFTQDLNTQEATVSIRLKEGKHSEVYNLVSRPLADNSVMKASKVNAAFGIRTSGASAVDGSMQCLDIDINESRCNNVLVSLNMKGHSKSTAKILVRNSFADMQLDLSKSSGNPEFETLKDFFMNSYMDRDSKNKVDTINFLSYEVVNGRAGFDIQIIGLNNEYIGFRGDQVASQAGSAVNVAVNKTSPRLNAGVEGNDKVHLNLQNSLGNVRLVMNDGNGKLTLKASSRAYRNYPIDNFKLTFTRRAKAVVKVSQERLP